MSRIPYKHPLFLPIITQILDEIDGVQDNKLLASASAEFRVEQTGSHDIGTGATLELTPSTRVCASDEWFRAFPRAS